jgi:hypothetical protein
MLVLADEVERRVLALLRIVERPVQGGELCDDAILDAWFGPRSPARWN